MPSGSISSPADSAPVPATESTASKLFLRPWKEMLLHRGWPTLHYLMKTEAHTFAFSVAANAILSFFPFMVLLMWLIRNVFHSQKTSVFHDIARHTGARQGASSEVGTLVTE